jgi:hypothetical protein
MEHQIPDNEELERRMRPGIFSVKGFLGPHEQLSDVLAHDAELLAATGASANQLATKLDALISLAVGSKRDVVVHSPFEIRITRFKGFQLCPWVESPIHGQCTTGGGVQFGSIDWHIRNKHNKTELKGPGLIVHLIRDHGFFEGPESPYRIDPVKLYRLLEPDVDVSSHK